MIGVVENISHSTAKTNGNRIDNDSILSAVTSGHMLIWAFCSCIDTWN
jgi:hypothetical protein